MHRRQFTASPRQDGPKPVLPMVQLPIYRVRQRDLEADLGRVYRLEHFDFHEATGITPGMCPEYVVSPTTPLAYHAQQEADRLRRGRKSGNIALILHVLWRTATSRSGGTSSTPTPSRRQPRSIGRSCKNG